VVRAGAGRAAPVAAVALAVVVVLAGCAGRIRDGVFRSEHGFRVTLPGPEWTVVDDSRAELELRRAAGGAGMLAHATCRPDAVRRSYDVLERHLLLGLRDRATLEDGEVDVAGRRAHRRVVEGRAHDAPTRVRIESYVLKDARCVYDLLYVASPAAFDGAHGDFRRFVQSFATE
jgi:hypothetical protein